MDTSPDSNPQNATRQVALVSAVVAVCLLGDGMLYAVLPAQAQRLGLRIALGGAAILSAVTTASYGLTWSFTLLVAARALWGMCWSVLRLGGYLTVLNVGRFHTQGHLMGVFMRISRLGSLAGAFCGGHDSPGSASAHRMDTIGFSHCFPERHGAVRRIRSMPHNPATEAAASLTIPRQTIILWLGLSSVEYVE